MSLGHQVPAETERKDLGHGAGPGPLLPPGGDEAARLTAQGRWGCGGEGKWVQSGAQGTAATPLLPWTWHLEKNESPARRDQGPPRHTETRLS